MSGLGFTRNDFEIFAAGNFSIPMQQILGRIQPRLARLGRELAPELTRAVRVELHPHVARHAHQSVRPPRESWVAWGPSPKSYARDAFLALSISAQGFHARAVLGVRADRKAEIGGRIAARAAELARWFGSTRLARFEDWDGGPLPAPQAADRAMFAALGQTLLRKTGAIDVGFAWPVHHAIRLERADLIDAFRELRELYRLMIAGE